jgi:ATP diphosphatase
MPDTLSRLAYADELQRRAAKEAFDWPSITPVFDKMQEELAELKDAIDQNEASTEIGRQHIMEELGDVLFCSVNLARYLDMDADQALQLTNEKFEKRFRYIERKMQENGRSMRTASLSELNYFWEEAKALP